MFSRHDQIMINQEMAPVKLVAGCTSLKPDVASIIRLGSLAIGQITKSPVKGVNLFVSRSSQDSPTPFGPPFGKQVI